jgi:hypothetical protein
MIRVYVASPFRGQNREETRQNIVYARLCMLDSLERGEAPYLSHLLYTQVWSEDPVFREAGLRAGAVYRESSELIAVYEDLGITDGMRDAAVDGIRPVERRRLKWRAVNIPHARTILATIPLGDFPELAR